MQFKYYINTIFAILTTNIVLLLGGYDKMLSTLVVFVIIDYVTGLAKAYKNNSINSYIGFKGITKKICLFLVIVVAHKFDGLGLSDPILRTIAIMFYISNEGISIIENMNELGVPIPQAIRDRLLNKKGD